MPSIFSRILAGTIPGAFVFRNERWAAILDIHPVAPGHSLLIPVHEGQHVADLPPETLAGLGAHLARLSTCVRTVTGAHAVNIVLNDGPAAGQEVPHAHWHVIPRFYEDGLSPGWRSGAYGPDEMGPLAVRMREAWGAG